MLEPTIIAKLTSISALTDIVPAGNMYPVRATDNTSLPFLVYSCSLDNSEQSLAGPVQFYSYTVVVEVYAVNFSTTADAIDAIREALDGWSTPDKTVRQSRLTASAPIPLDEGYGYGAEFRVIARV